MIFCPNQLGQQYRKWSYIMSGNTPATHLLKPFNCLVNLLRSFAYVSVCSEFSLVNLFLHISNTASPSSFIF